MEQSPQNMATIQIETSRLPHERHSPSLEEDHNASGQPEADAHHHEEAESPGPDLPLSRRKGKRRAGLPGRYQQSPPRLPTPMRAMPELPLLLPKSLKEVRNLALYQSKPNMFGVVVKYRLPDPTAAENPANKPVQSRNSDATASTSPRPSASVGRFGPFDNRTGFLLAEWYWNSLNKSFADFQQLVTIFRDPGFSLDDAVDTNWRAAYKALGANSSEFSKGATSWISDDGWRTTPVSIDIPFHNQSDDPGIKPYLVGDFHHRSLLSVIKEKVTTHGRSDHFHYYPHQAIWRRTDNSPEMELYGEIYASRSFRDAHEDVQHQPSTPENRGLERVVVALMIWSDATHLTSFGGASLWPCYIFFGNESKYRRAQPSEHLGEHVAYFLKLPDKINDHLAERNGGKLPSDQLIAYCTRLLLHKQWSILLDEEFVKAAADGLVFTCPDGQERRFYPRIFTYSADYPEKIRIAGIRNNGDHPCHRCLVSSQNLFKLGAPSDLERRDAQRDYAQQESIIAHGRTEIERGYAVNSGRFEPQFKEHSLVPLHTAFTTALSLDIGPALVVDILHEFEIGAWKKLFIHLIRLLKAFSSSEDATLTARLDIRYRQVPAFGRDNIRKFPLNASEMKRKAARDFENLLQCAIATFEGLLPEPHNSGLMTLLYICAQWHSLAKLRLHNDLTLSLLEYTTAHLGAKLRLFDKSTGSVPTTELKAEAEARARQEIRQGTGKGSSAQRPKRLAIYTIKFHFLGDYPAIIRKYGTTDSYSTQIGELYHRSPKSWYKRTDRKDYEAQLPQTERRQARLRQIRANLTRESPSSPSVHSEEVHRSVASYSIGTSQGRPIYLNQFRDIPDGETNRWTEFIPSLKQHLLPRVLRELGYPPQAFGEDAWQHVVLRDERLYCHKILRVSYTAYDTLQGEDVVHVDTPQCNIMLLKHGLPTGDQANEPIHPYCYAKVKAVYHADVTFAGPLPAFDGPRGHYRLDFVWVHWYQFLPSRTEFALDQVVPASLYTGEAFEFIDPATILRAVHLIPRFALEKTHDEVDERESSPSSQAQWRAYYVNRFADRDLFMRYQYGMAVGHTYTHTRSFPDPTIPSIPPDFDWCLDIEQPSRRRGKRQPDAAQPSNTEGTTVLDTDTTMPANDQDLDDAASDGDTDLEAEEREEELEEECEELDDAFASTQVEDRW